MNNELHTDCGLYGLDQIERAMRKLGFDNEQIENVLLEVATSSLEKEYLI